MFRAKTYLAFEGHLVYVLSHVYQVALFIEGYEIRR